MLFNITDMKTIRRVEKTRAYSTNFDNNFLKFGNEEITMKNNQGKLEVNISTAIIGEKYYNFKRDELLGRRDEYSAVALEAMEIHRIYGSE